MQFCGKDNLRYQSAIWQKNNLMAVNIPNSTNIIIDGLFFLLDKNEAKSLEML